MSRTGQAAPLIARVAGLPCDVLEPFSTSLGERVEARRQAEALLEAARAELAERLHQRVPGAEPAARRVLLAAKRDCHNGRPLRAAGADWAVVEEAAGPQAARVLELERSVEEEAGGFAAAYEEALQAQLRRAGTLLDEPLFRCGLGVASPVLARQAAQLQGEAAGGQGRRAARVAEAVARYASRAALKLSPFSTFTHVGVARVDAGAAPPSLAPAWEPRSLVRLRRHLVDRCFDLLRRYPPVRRELGVALNDSVTPLEDGRILFQRPSHYRVDETRKLAFNEDALVRTGLRGPMAACLRDLLGAGPMPYGRLVMGLARALGDAPEAETGQQLDRLIDVGYLHLLAPWRVDDGHAEKSLLAWLDRLSADAALEPLRAELRALVALEEGLLHAADPGAALLEMHRLIPSIVRHAAALAAIPDDVNVVGKEWEHEVYQDVWCTPRGGTDAVVAVGREPLDRALRSVAPLVRFTRLFDPHLDFLCTLGAALRERSGARCRVPFMEALHFAQPLWQDFMRFRVENRQTEGGWRNSWNPRALPRLAELARWRDEVWRAFPGTLEDGADGRRVSVPALEALLEPVPARYTEDQAGACLFLQPAAADGSLWMLNRVKEGTGRFASRYTPLMEPELRRRYGAELAARAARTVDGEPVRLLDVQCVQGDTLNVHSPQTPEVLVLPGASIDLPRERQRRLDDLVISLADDDWPTVRDREGTRFLPVHLGVGFMDYMPTLLKFLCAFGPSELGAVFPPPLVRGAGGIARQERTVIGNVVLHRRAWTVQAAELRALFDGCGGAEAFDALHRWCRDHGLPGRVFAIERTPHPIAGRVNKPQYLDLTSPIFASVLRSIVKAAGATLQLVEALPSPDTFPADAAGRRWALEILVDSLAMTPVHDPADAPRPAPERASRARRAPALAAADGGG